MYLLKDEGIKRIEREREWPYESTPISSEDVFPSHIIQYTKSSVLFYRPPEQVEVRYIPESLGRIMDGLYDEEFTFNLWLPPTVYFTNFNYRSREQGVRLSGTILLALQDTDLYDFHLDNFDISKLRLLPLCNYYETGSFCLPGMNPVSPNLNAITAAAYSSIWGSVFNHDVTHVSFMYVRDHAHIGPLGIAAKQGRAINLTDDNRDLLTLYQTWEEIGFAATQMELTTPDDVHNPGYPLTYETVLDWVL